MITLNLPITFEQEAFLDHVLWSGGLGWGSWWGSSNWSDEALTLTGYADNPETDDDGTWSMPYLVRLEDLVKAAQLAASENKYVAEQLIKDDVDAIGADIILQYAVFGEVVYG